MGTTALTVAFTISILSYLFSHDVTRATSNESYIFGFTMYIVTTYHRTHPSSSQLTTRGAPDTRLMVGAWGVGATRD